MNATPADKVALRQKWDKQVLVCERAEREIKGLKENVKRSTLLMDLDSIPFDLDALLAANRYEFSHDICGMVSNMDRSTYPGKLKGLFWPRFADQEGFKP